MRTYENLFPEKRPLISKRTADKINFIVTIIAVIIVNVAAKQLNIQCEDIVMYVISQLFSRI